MSDVGCVVGNESITNGDEQLGCASCFRQREWNASGANGV